MAQNHFSLKWSEFESDFWKARCFSFVGDHVEDEVLEGAVEGMIGDKNDTIHQSGNFLKALNYLVEASKIKNSTSDEISIKKESHESENRNDDSMINSNTKKETKKESDLFKLQASSKENKWVLKKNTKNVKAERVQFDG